MTVIDVSQLTAQKVADLIARKFSGEVVFTVNLHGGGITRLTARHEENLTPDTK